MDGGILIGKEVDGCVGYLIRNLEGSTSIYNLSGKLGSWVDAGDWEIFIRLLL